MQNRAGVNQQKIYRLHKKPPQPKIYADDDPVWNAPLTNEDARRIITAVVARAIWDEIITYGVNMEMDIMQRAQHARYLEKNLRVDCEMLGIDPEQVLRFMREGKNKKDFKDLMGFYE